MKPEDNNSELRRAYQNLVETVEDLVVKEGKTLQQAMFFAEDKLSEWNELSKKQVQDISEELNHDLKTLGENLNGATEAYKEQFKLDAAYVTDSVWEKLLNVMDENTAQLSVFIKDLKDQAQANTTDHHIEEHQEHTQWNSEHELWLSEVDLWKEEHATALSQLTSIEKMIKQHSDALDEHAQAIKAHQASSHEHEVDIANAEKDPSSQVYEETEDHDSETHDQERQEHLQHAQLHKTMKRHHLKIMSLVSELYKKTV